jgi:hypothetical protein
MLSLSSQPPLLIVRSSALIHGLSAYPRDDEIWHLRRVDILFIFATASKLAPAPLSHQFFQQPLGLLQVFGVKAFGEPAVNIGEHLPRFVLLALPLPQTG